MHEEITPPSYLRTTYGANVSVDDELPHVMELDRDTGVITGQPDMVRHSERLQDHRSHRLLDCE